MTTPEITLDGVLNTCRHLIDAGAALHWLKPRDKMPIEKDWTNAPVPSEADLVASHRKGFNIGIRLGEPSKTPWGYLHIIDLDIRDETKAGEAWAALKAMWPDVSEFPTVVSGSGGESRHFWFITDRPFRKKKLAKSSTFKMVHDPEKGRDVKKNDWEIDLLGTGSQAVLPPSIHPSGRPYRWLTPLDLDAADLGIGPFLDADLVAGWGAAPVEDDTGPDDDDDLMSLVRTAPLGLDEAEIDAVLADLPEDWVDDRDTWYQVGMALHHEYEGSQNGFEKWCEWSRQSEKFDAKDQFRVWKSFKGTRNPVRMATLMHAANQNRLARDMAVIETLPELPDEDVEDLFGEVTESQEQKAEDSDWMSLLAFTDDGGIRNTLHNIELIIANDRRIAGCIAFNEFTQEIVLFRKPRRFKLKKPGPKPVKQLEGRIWQVNDPINGDLWQDPHDSGLRAVLEAPRRQGGYDIRISDRDLASAIANVAQQNAIHPVKDYLMTVAEGYDRLPRVDTVFIDYLGAADTPYHRQIARLTLIGAVARIFEPGHKFDFVPILEGVQGKGKSTFIESLACNWFSELEGDLHDRKQMVEKMQGAWILEIPELQGFHKAEVTTLKGLLTARHDKVRMPYGRRATVFPRQCIFMGSTNDPEYLRDSTGNRRFWPVYCAIDEIDNAKLLRNVDQIWAEAVHMYRHMRKKCQSLHLPLYLSDPKAAEEALLLQEDRRVDTPEEALAGEIERWLNQPVGSELGLDDLDPDAPKIYRNQVCVREIWVEMMGRDGPTDPRNSQIIGKALRAIEGWYAADRRPTEKYGRQRVFRRKGVKFDD